jgi:hypothetical protein
MARGEYLLSSSFSYSDADAAGPPTRLAGKREAGAAIAGNGRAIAAEGPNHRASAERRRGALGGSRDHWKLNVVI